MIVACMHMIQIKTRAEVEVEADQHIRWVVAPALAVAVETGPETAALLNVINPNRMNRNVAVHRDHQANRNRRSPSHCTWIVNGSNQLKKFLNHVMVRRPNGRAFWRNGVAIIVKPPKILQESLKNWLKIMKKSAGFDHHRPIYTTNEHR